MKLYTEEQLTRYLLDEGIMELSDLANNLVPCIELPSDEEIKKVLIQYNDYLFTFIDKDEIGINVETEDVIKWYNKTYGGGEQ
jgi:hypothetical protein